MGLVTRSMVRLALVHVSFGASVENSVHRVAEWYEVSRDQIINSSALYDVLKRLLPDHY